MALLFSWDDFQFNTVVGKNFAHGSVVSKCSFISRFLAYKTNSDIQSGCDTRSKYGGIQLRLRRQLIGALNEVCRESGVGDNVVAPADDGNTFHIFNTLLNE